MQKIQPNNLHAQNALWSLVLSNAMWENIVIFLNLVRQNITEMLNDYKFNSIFFQIKSLSFCIGLNLSCSDSNSRFNESTCFNVKNMW